MYFLGSFEYFILNKFYLINRLNNKNLLKIHFLLDIFQYSYVNCCHTTQKWHPIQKHFYRSAFSLWEYLWCIQTLFLPREFFLRNQFDLHNISKFWRRWQTLILHWSTPIHKSTRYTTLYNAVYWSLSMLRQYTALNNTIYGVCQHCYQKNFKTKS
jgi:hypothetical protein